MHFGLGTMIISMAPFSIVVYLYFELREQCKKIERSVESSRV